MTVAPLSLVAMRLSLNVRIRHFPNPVQLQPVCFGFLLHWRAVVFLFLAAFYDAIVH